MARTGDAASRHAPVMLSRIVSLLAPALGEPGAVVVDGTLGMGGHAEALLAALIDLFAPSAVERHALRRGEAARVAA